MAKDKNTPAPASFINEEKSLIQIKGIENIAKIYFDAQKFIGTPKDSLESALKNKGFIVEVAKDKNPNIRNINTQIYFAELDLTKEVKKRSELSEALKGDDAEAIQNSKLKYGLAVFLNRESISPQRFEDDLAKRFDYVSKKNEDRPDYIEFYKKQIKEEFDSFNQAYDVLSKAGIAKTSERGTMYLENFNTFKKVELIKILESPYVDINESTLKKAMTIASDNKAISDEAFKTKADAKTEDKPADVKVEEKPTTEVEEKVEEKTTKKRTSKPKK